MSHDSHVTVYTDTGVEPPVTGVKQASSGTATRTRKSPCHMTHVIV